MNELDKKVEAILFGSGKSVSSSRISNVLNEDEEKIKKSLENLASFYNNLDSSIMIEKIGTKWRMGIRADYVDVISSFIKELELPNALLETISVILYKYPITQSELVKIRSNKAYAHLDQLEELGFIKKEKKGNTYLIKATKQMKDYFDYNNEKEFKDMIKNDV
ncbi:MAG: SMC-Scp complex subunit ScpB [Candidatus Nanoarchaeia archaeon]|nr:SMC-Scp complex subunit ScpB [Candidatus Nanoarchaeia archaeon]